MDDNKTIFKYNPKTEAFSAIQAEFLLKNEIQARNIMESIIPTMNHLFRNLILCLPKKQHNPRQRFFCEGCLQPWIV